MAGQSLINNARPTTGPANNNATWHRKAFEYTGAEQSVLSIRPSIRINVDNRTHLEIGDMINIDMTKGGDNIFSNAFYVDFRWSF
jgi:hypothetical protein